jgi:MSHA type pilus biogenesis protein MshL
MKISVAADARIGLNMDILGIKGRDYTMYSSSKHFKARLKSTTFPLLLTAFLGVSGCANTGGPLDPELYDHHDRQENLSRDDYRYMMRPDPNAPDKQELKPYIDGAVKPSAELKSAPIPEISDILATPRPPAIGEKQLVSLFVTDDVPLKDVLIELGRLADVDMEIDSSIQGGIVFRAQNRPFNEVIERISRLAGLRYEMQNGVLRVERDTPVVKTYPVDFLSFTRSSSSNIAITTSVLSSTVGGGGGGGGGGGDSLSSGSSAEISYENEGDFWTQLTAGLQAVVNYTPANRSSAPDVVVANSAGGGGGGADGAAAGAGNIVNVNRQAGTVTVSAPDYVQGMVQDYLNKVSETVSSQVLIEAKIVEVTLNEQYQSGINWNQVFSSRFLTMDADFNNIDTGIGNLTELVIGGTSAADPSLDAIVSLTEQFGTTRTLSSPRLHAMNNQQAVLTFAQNLVYFDVDVQREQQVSGDTVLPPLLTVDAEPVTVPIGIIISLQPVINTRTNEVTLSVRPTLSRVIDFVPDPSVAFLLAELDSTVSNQIPQIEVRELDSLMRMRSGQIMVLGGLLEQVGEDTDTGVPFLSEVPWVGNAFKAVNKQNQVRELFILVKATIVGNNSNYHDADQHIYKKFTTDHRPLAF